MARQLLWTRERVLETVRVFVEAEGRLPLKGEWGRAGLPYHGSVWRYFPTEATLADALELPPRCHRQQRPALTTRACLRCEHRFPSTGPHHRLCNTCRYDNRIDL